MYAIDKIKWARSRAFEYRQTVHPILGMNLENTREIHRISQELTSLLSENRIGAVKSRMGDVRKMSSSIQITDTLA